MKSTKEKAKAWQTTKEPNLLKNVSGRYYARFKIAGKQKWINLDTAVWSVAVLRIADERARVVRTRMAHEHVASGIATMGELAKIYRTNMGAAQISPATKKRYTEHVAAVEKTWPEFSNLKPERLTRGAVIAWRDRVAQNGTGFIAPGAKQRSRLIDGSSASYINKMIDVIRRMVEIAVERGQLPASPLQGRGIKMRVAPRKPYLPEAKTLETIFATMESRGLGRPLYCAELCRGLAYTGMRLSEAVGDAEIGAEPLKWADVDFARGIVRIHGTKTDAADREVPLIPAARRLFETIRARRLEAEQLVAGQGATVDPKSRVFIVSEAAKSLARACAEVGVQRLTHHDLRDAFATMCIEAGVDIPTVAAWLGHKDGGALLMRVYAHHRRDHSLAQAAKVNFGGGTPA